MLQNFVNHYPMVAAAIPFIFMAVAVWFLLREDKKCRGEKGGYFR